MGQVCGGGGADVTCDSPPLGSGTASQVFFSQNSKNSI